MVRLCNLIKGWREVNQNSPELLKRQVNHSQRNISMTNAFIQNYNKILERDWLSPALFEH